MKQPDVLISGSAHFGGVPTLDPLKGAVAYHVLNLWLLTVLREPLLNVGVVIGSLCRGRRSCSTRALRVLLLIRRGRLCCEAATSRC